MVAPKNKETLDAEILAALPEKTLVSLMKENIRYSSTLLLRDQDNKVILKPVVLSPSAFYKETVM